MAAFTIQIQIQVKEGADPSDTAAALVTHIGEQGHTVLSATTTNSIETTPEPKPE